MTMSDLQELQQQNKHLVELIQKLTMEFGAVKAELEESRLDVDSIHSRNIERIIRSEHITRRVNTIKLCLHLENQ